MNQYCPQWQGVIEYRLEDRTRVDCLIDTLAMEFDWCRKWAEGVGQSLFYAKMTDKKPVLVLNCTEEEKEKFVRHASLAAPEVKIITIEKR